MDPNSDKDKFVRPSYVASVEPPERTGLVSVEDIKTDLSDEFFSASSSSDTSRRSSLEPRGHIQVCLRVKPFTALERENESQGCISLEDSTSVILKPPKSSLSQLSEKTAGQMMQKFTFSRVFGPETTQEEFFEGAMKQPVQDFLEGYNRLVFTYGITNAGKTYTFQGTEDNVGILPRTMDMLFKTIGGKLYTKMDLKPIRWRDYMKLTKEQVREETALKNSLLRLTKEVDSAILTNGKAPVDSKGVENLLKGSEQSSRLPIDNCFKFSVWVSFFEIYNECFYDLLVPMSNDKKRKTLRLAQDIKGYSYVKGLQWVQVSNSKEAFRLFKLGLKHQSFASTKLNTCSSRSHSVFTVKVLKIEDFEIPRVTRVNELSLCDLAGSERYTKTRNEGDRLKESGNINTSLLTLSKCINALKISQQSKVQQHIPFRESKLTHFLQGFFSGKGKIHMIVNISQCTSACDETLNVLRFSAIAQKVIVTDASVPPHDQSFGQKSASGSSTLCCAKMTIPERSTGFLWDQTLEDVIEDDDDVEMEEDNMSGEETMLKYDENKVLVGKEECTALLNLVEDLKNKLIAEKKDKLLLELKIREEVTQEFTQYFAEREMEFKECLSHERERLEENSEKRLEIFKELVSGYAKNPEEEESNNLPCSEQAKPMGGEYSVVPNTCADLEGIIESLQNDVTDIKKQAEAAHSYIASLEDPQESMGWLQMQLGNINFELMKTKEELTEKDTKLLKTEEELSQKNRDFEMQMIKLDETVEQLKEATEKINTQNERIQELMDIVVQKDDAITKLQDLISHLEETVKDYDNTITTIKTKLAEENSNKVTENSQFKECEKSELKVERKHCLEDKPTVEEPPAKKVVKERKKKNTLEQKRIEHLKRKCSAYHMEILALRERTEALERHLAAVEEQCRREKNKKERFSKQVTTLRLELSFSEERAAEFCEKIQQYRADYQEIASELDEQRSINMGLEEKNVQLNNVIEVAKQNIIDKVSQIKTMQSKLDELYKHHLESSAMDVDLVNLKDSLGAQEGEPETSQISAVCIQSQTTISDLVQDRSFYCSIENIWEVCKSIDVSSQKSWQVKALLQEVENLRKGLKDAENYNNQLEMKLSEITNHDSQSVKEDLLNQLQEQLKKKTQDFEKKTAEDHRVIAQFEEEVTNCKVKIRELECLLEAFRTKEDSVTKLKELLKEKESIILNLETITVALQEKSANADKKVEELSNEEANLMEEVMQLKNNLEQMKHTLWEKEKSEKEKMQSIELLNKDLSESSALVQNLKKDLQWKEEEYTDLKEKLSDAKKQIQQVQKEVSTMRSEEKSMRNKINELERIKRQLGEELDIKKRTIWQLQQEQLNNKKLEEVSRQYERIHKDLCAKEKVIEDMRMTLEEQEQTQADQDQALEAELKENERLTSELETWKQKYRELNNQSNSDQWQKNTKSEEANINENNTELIKLQKELKESGAKYQTDRKRWLEEKEGLINQIKEAECLRNRELKRFAEERQRHGMQQAEIERLVTQLKERDNTLQKWREEKDQLVEALEIQLKTLASNAIQKDKEIAELKQSALKESRKDNETVIEELRKELADKDDFIKELKQCINHDIPQSSPEVPLLEERQDKMDHSVNEEYSQPMKKQRKMKYEGSIPVRHEAEDNYSSSQCLSSVTSLNESEEHSESVLDSSEVSTENGKTSRFPKPEVDIRLTPLKPDKMEIKQHSSMLAVRMKMPKSRKNSDDMDEVSAKQKYRKEYSLREREPTSSKKLASKKDAALQKIGNFFQSSPSIIHSKAKKLIATVSSQKSSEPENLKEPKPKQSKRKLYSADISGPLDISASSVCMEQNEKESDHLIIKRRLRSRTAK
ncbi:kinesin-like protein KIF20B isoform X2 [Numida meleagris]|uniref:kinesin-like protein KIF20B isoform X2 n=1 Tax=Numida meleagris TaxID=8996 RepID=UPI000B3E2B2D|nr:kinesin-like protein KIF20B isoform X2 [Numida meleagris]